MTVDSESERRRQPRMLGAGVRARVRPGYRLVVVDLSIAGALVEGARPLRPGSQVDVQLESELRKQVIPAIVVRCVVGSIHAESGVTYRAALSFAETCDWVREVVTPEGYRLPGDGLISSMEQTCDGDSLPAASKAPALHSVKATK